MTVVELGGKKYPFHYGLSTNIAMADKGVPADKKGTYTFLLYLECINQGLVKQAKDKGKPESEVKKLSEEEFLEILEDDFVEKYAVLDKAIIAESEKKK